jgi:hypothetical protein
MKTEKACAVAQSALCIVVGLLASCAGLKQPAPDRLAGPWRLEVALRHARGSLAERMRRELGDLPRYVIDTRIISATGHIIGQPLIVMPTNTVAKIDFPMPLFLTGPPSRHERARAEGARQSGRVNQVVQETNGVVMAVTSGEIRVDGNIVWTGTISTRLQDEEPSNQQIQPIAGQPGSG